VRYGSRVAVSSQQVDSEKKEIMGAVGRDAQVTAFVREWFTGRGWDLEKLIGNVMDMFLPVLHLPRNSSE
jgi:hypothetical protein